MSNTNNTNINNNTNTNINNNNTNTNNINNTNNKEDNHIVKQHNKSLLPYHIVFPIKYRKKIITKEIEETIIKTYVVME